MTPEQQLTVWPLDCPLPMFATSRGGHSMSPFSLTLCWISFGQFWGEAVRFKEGKGRRLGEIGMLFPLQSGLLCPGASFIPQPGFQSPVFPPTPLPSPLVLDHNSVPVPTPALLQFPSYSQGQNLTPVKFSLPVAKCSPEGQS